jgi:leucyl-tRNA synthetase
MMYREAMMSGFFNLQIARDTYRAMTGGDYSAPLLRRFFETQTLLLAPICPHYAEHVWRKLGHVKGGGGGC